MISRCLCAILAPKGDQGCFLNGVKKLWLAMLLLFKLNVAMSAEAAGAVPMPLLLETIESSCDEAFQILFEANLTAQLTVITSTAPGISPSYISSVVKFPDSVESKKQAIHDEVDRHLKREEIEERKKSVKSTQEAMQAMSSQKQGGRVSFPAQTLKLKKENAPTSTPSPKNNPQKQEATRGGSE